jgi:hypothetical protein
MKKTKHSCIPNKKYQKRKKEKETRHHAGPMELFAQQQIRQMGQVVLIQALLSLISICSSSAERVTLIGRTR